MSSLDPGSVTDNYPVSYSKPAKRRRHSSSSRSRSPVPQHHREKEIKSPVRRRHRRYSSSRSTSPVLTKNPSNINEMKESLPFEGRPSNRRGESLSRSASPLDSAKNGSSTREKVAPPSQNIDLFGKTGGAYIPPARLRQMQAKITDKSTDAYQRIAWEALKKSIHGLINKVNVSNISQVVRQLFMENIIRGRGLLVKSLVTSQMASPTFTHIFAALIAIVNTKLPQIGELLLKRLINEFRKAFRRNQKDRCLTIGRFLAHLVNQKVAHELIVLELLTLLLEQTTNDSVEVSVALLKECGAFLSRVVPKGLAGIFDHLRRILNESQCDKRISYMIEVLLQIRRDKWRDYPTVLPELDLIEEDDQIIHTISLLDQVDAEDNLNIYHFDPDYEANEAKYTEIRESFLGDDNSSESSSSGSDDEEGSDDEADVQGPGEQEGGVIIDQTETNLVHLRRTIYLMLQSSISADEGAHRLLQLKIKPGEEYEVASMVLDCCAQTRSYETRYGSLAQRLCRVMLFTGDKTKPGETTKSSEPSEPPRTYVAQFEKIFSEQYATIHRLETSKLKNVAMFFAHLLFTDSISWGVLECVKLNERDTSSSGRIFLKYLFQELCSFMGLAKLQARLRDVTLQPFFAHLLPRDNPKDTRFAINFLTTIGLGGLTIDLREHLQATKAAGEKVKFAEAVDDLSSSSDSDPSSSSSDSSDSESSTSSSSSGSSSSSSSSDSDEESEEESSQKLLKIRRKKSNFNGEEVVNLSTNPQGDKASRENGVKGDKPAKKPASMKDREITSNDQGDVRRREGISSSSLSPLKRRPDSPSLLTISVDERSTGGDRNIRNASPPRIVEPTLNIPSPSDDGRSKRPGREPSPVVEKRRRYNSPSPTSNYRQPSLSSCRVAASSIASKSSRLRADKQSRHNVGSSFVRRGTSLSSPSRNEKSLNKTGYPSASRRQKQTPTPPHRNRLLSPSSADVVKSPGRRKDVSTPRHKSRYDSPISRTERRRVPSRDRNLKGVNSSSHRKETPAPPRRSRCGSTPSSGNNFLGSPRRRRETASPRGNRCEPNTSIQGVSKRDRRREVSLDLVVDSRRKVTPIAPRISRYASPSPLPKESSSGSPRRKRNTPSPRRNRYHSPPTVQKGGKRNRRRDVSRERIIGGRRRDTPVPPHRDRYASPPSSRMDREPRRKHDISKERVSDSHRRQDESRDIDKNRNQRRHDHRRSSSSNEQKMRNASPPAHSSARDRSPFKHRKSPR